MASDTKNQVKEIMEQVKGYTIECPLSAKLADAGIDSLDLMDIVKELEERFGILFEDSDVEGLSTLGSLVALVDKKLQAKNQR